MTAPRTPRKRARPQQVYERLRELIIDGRLAPGTRIVETDVAARLGVSRTPVRGALQRLQQEGFVVDSPTLQQTRPTVAPLTSEDARELFLLVGALEGLAASSRRVRHAARAHGARRGAGRHQRRVRVPPRPRSAPTTPASSSSTSSSTAAT